MLKVKKLISAGGENAFSPLDALIKILSYGSRRADYETLAISLLERFESLENVFSAELCELDAVGGLEPGAAVLLKLVPQMFEICICPRIDGSETSCRYFKDFFSGVDVEELCLVCLSDKLYVKKCEVIASGNDVEVTFNAQKLIEKVKDSGCRLCMIAHNHPGGPCEPSEDDISATNSLAKLLEEEGIHLIEHVIVGADGAKTFSAGNWRHISR